MKGCGLYLMLSFPDSNLESYKNSYILVGKRLKYITFAGQYEDKDVKRENIEKFLQNISKINPKNESKLHLSNEQANDLITLNGGHTRMKSNFCLLPNSYIHELIPLGAYGLPTFIRVTIGQPEQNEKFLNSFQSVMESYESDG